MFQPETTTHISIGTYRDDNSYQAFSDRRIKALPVQPVSDNPVSRPYSTGLPDIPGRISGIATRLATYSSARRQNES